MTDVTDLPPTDPSIPAPPEDNQGSPIAPPTDTPADVPAPPVQGVVVNDQDAKRLAQEAGWSSEHFKFKADVSGNLAISEKGWIGDEVLLVEPANVPELIDELRKFAG